MPETSQGFKVEPTPPEEPHALTLARQGADAARQRRVKQLADQAQAQDTALLPARYKGYDADQSRHIVQRLGHGAIANGIAITNGGMEIGQSVATDVAGGSVAIDAMPRVRTTRAIEPEVAESGFDLWVVDDVRDPFTVIAEAPGYGYGNEYGDVEAMQGLRLWQTQTFMTSAIFRQPRYPQNLPSDRQMGLLGRAADEQWGNNRQPFSSVIHFAQRGNTILGLGAWSGLDTFRQSATAGRAGYEKRYIPVVVSTDRGRSWTLCEQPCEMAEMRRKGDYQFTYGEDYLWREDPWLYLTVCSDATQFWMTGRRFRSLRSVDGFDWETELGEEYQYENTLATGGRSGTDSPIAAVLRWVGGTFWASGLTDIRLFTDRLGAVGALAFHGVMKGGRVLELKPRREFVHNEPVGSGYISKTLIYQLLDCVEPTIAIEWIPKVSQEIVSYGDGVLNQSATSKSTFRTFLGALGIYNWEPASWVAANSSRLIRAAVNINNAIFEWKLAWTDFEEPGKVTLAEIEWPELEPIPEPGEKITNTYCTWHPKAAHFILAATISTPYVDEESGRLALRYRTIFYVSPNGERWQRQPPDLNNARCYRLFVPA